MYIKIFNHTKMEKYLHSLDYATCDKNKLYIINYYGEGEKKVNFSNCKAHVIQMYMDDVRFSDVVKDFANVHKDDFERVAKFIKNAMSNEGKIICSCDAGISRSAATAKAIMEYYFKDEHKIDETGEYIPSPTYYDAIINALNEVNK